MKINVLEYNKEIDNSILKIDIIDENINNSHINALRRIMLSSIYIRAFDTLNISKNTSIRNNSQLEKFVSQFPVWISDNSIDNQKDIFKYNIENDDSNIKLPSLNQLTMYLKYTNTMIV